MSHSLDDLLRRFDAGSKRAAARLISIVEDDRPESFDVLDRLFPRVGQAYRLGITGPPGAGKSTLVDRLAERLVADGESPGIVAVDPTSPFTGGALLGDRVRMGPVANDRHVFFRSLASRGSLGGLSLHASEVADVLDAFGCTWLLLETVGVGQSELDVADKAHSTIVMLVPESGDGIQAMKSGLMEIADVFLVNKADRQGADRLMDDLRTAIELREWSGWKPPILPTQARDGDGIDAVFDALRAHRAWLGEGDHLREQRRRAMESRVRDLTQATLQHDVWSHAAIAQGLEQGLQEIEAGTNSPYRLARSLAAQAWREIGPANESRA